MAKRIKHVSELPSWFDLKKYDFAEKLDALGWYQQLAIRGMCIYRIAEYIEDKQPYPEGLLLAIQTLRENPYSTILKDGKLSEYFPNTQLFDLLNPETHTNDLLGISSITMNDYLRQRLLINNERLAYAEKLLNASTSNNKISEEAPWMHEPLHSSYHTDVNTDILKIDLSLADNFLIDHFKIYLKNRRKIRNPNKIKTKYFGDTDFHHWTQLKILAYLDLIILEYELNKRIPFRILADAIYPNGEKGEETIRKTTNPVASRLMGFHALYQLATQAAHKIAEKITS